MNTSSVIFLNVNSTGPPVEFETCNDPVTYWRFHPSYSGGTAKNIAPDMTNNVSVDPVIAKTIDLV